MQAVVGCKVEGMEEQIGQPNLCWFCANIVHCNPLIRPQCNCENYEPLGRYISHKRIADWIGISERHLTNIINRYGVEKIIELLAMRGHIVRYEVVNQYVKFYEIGEKK